VKALLSKHRDASTYPNPAKFEEKWDSLEVDIAPLRAAIEEMAGGLLDVQEGDFGTTNHYAQLAYKAGMAAMAKKVLDLLPVSRNK